MLQNVGRLCGCVSQNKTLTSREIFSNHCPSHETYASLSIYLFAGLVRSLQKQQMNTGDQVGEFPGTDWIDKKPAYRSIEIQR